MNDNSTKIHFITTGGTIDSAWDGALDSIAISEKSNLPSFFDKYKLLGETLFTQVCAKDSRALDENDLQSILKAVEESPAIKIVITHGTFTMPDTARFLKKNVKRSDQSIVLTGSTAPLKSFDMSDAGLNLGYAIAKVQDLPSGIYIAMKGKAFSIDEIDKEIESGRFHEIFSSA
jgi:L-asparaginase